jgi:ubiquitin-protein ligase
MQFVLLNQPRRIVYMISPAKNSDDVFIAYDPFDANKEKFKKDEVAPDDILPKYAYISLRDNVLDVRPIEQLTVILFDVSSSMQHTPAFNFKSLLDLSICALGAWCDKFYSYRLPHAIALIYCGAKVTSTTQLIHEGCPITNNFSDFENSLQSRPTCGSSTPLYDSIELALKRMNQFYEQHKNKISTNYQKLIICLSDGEDNCSKMNLPTITNRLQQEKIIFDSICFTSRQAASLVHLCKSTSGYYYFPIPHSEKDLITLFEREPTMVLKIRDKNVDGVVERPKLCQPKSLFVPARNFQGAPVQDMPVSNRYVSRILREANNIKQKSLENFTIFVCNGNALFWKLIMTGPKDTYYYGYTWLLSVEFSQEYPFRPPTIRFVTPIYHCNISDDGIICHEILRSHWTHQTTMYDVLKQITALLYEPEPNDAISTVKGNLYNTAREDYYKELKEYNEKYAKATIEQLKKQYQLEQSDI